MPVEDVALREIVMVEVPAGVTIGGGVIEALPPPQPARANVIQRIVVERAPQRARRFLRVVWWIARTFLWIKAYMRKSRASKVGAGRGTREMGGMRSGADGGNWAGPLVVTVAVNVAEPPASETLAGTWHTAPRGAPLQLSPTMPAKPELGVS